MNIEEVKSFIEENKDSKEVMELFNSNMPSLEQTMEKPEFQKAMKSFADKEARRQVEAYKENTFDKSVEEAVAKRIEANNHKEPWEIKIAQMEQNQIRLENQLKEKDRNELIGINKTNAIKTLTEKNLPIDLVDFLVSDDGEKTTSNIEMMSGVFETYGQNLKQGMLKNNNVNVPGNKATSISSDVMPGDDASQENWEKYYKKKGTNNI